MVEKAAGGEEVVEKDGLLKGTYVLPLGRFVRVRPGQEEHLYCVRVAVSARTVEWRVTQGTIST